MIELYRASGAGGFSVLNDGIPTDQTTVLFENAGRLLSARNQHRAAEMLRSTPFAIRDGTNHFNDEFNVLFTSVPLAEYEKFKQGQASPVECNAIQQIAEVLTELGTYIRFVAAELRMEPAASAPKQEGRALKPSEIQKVVNKYIGVSGGYLGDFSYRSHHEFYVDLDLDIDPSKYQGTTRERFITILHRSTPEVQARILQGVLERYPQGSVPMRTQERVDEIKRWISRLRAGPHVDQPTLRITSDVVERALNDAQELLRANGATSGVDRIHTALHGYLRQVC